MIGFRARLLTSAAYAHNVESHELAKYCAREQEFNRNPAVDRGTFRFEKFTTMIKNGGLLELYTNFLF